MHCVSAGCLTYMEIEDSNAAGLAENASSARIGLVFWMWALMSLKPEPEPIDSPLLRGVPIFGALKDMLSTHDIDKIHGLSLLGKNRKYLPLAQDGKRCAVSFESYWGDYFVQIGACGLLCPLGKP